MELKEQKFKVIKIKYCCLHFKDLLVAKKILKGYNIGLGQECIGIIEQVGENVKEFNVNDKANNIRRLDDNKLLALDPTLPRTRDYTCKNVNCITHKSKDKKEAVFLRIPKSYNLSYVCTQCNYSWNSV